MPAASTVAVADPLRRGVRQPTPMISYARILVENSVSGICMSVTISVSAAGRVGDFAMLKAMGGNSASVSRAWIPWPKTAAASAARGSAMPWAGDLAHAARCLGAVPHLRTGRARQQARSDDRFSDHECRLLRRSTPLRGVFAVQVLGLADAPLPGVANIGNRPTLQGDDRLLLEVHLFDFERRRVRSACRGRFRRTHPRRAPLRIVRRAARADPARCSARATSFVSMPWPAASRADIQVHSQHSSIDHRVIVREQQLQGTTLNLPNTAFPMKANLAQREPEMLGAGRTKDLTARSARACAGRDKFVCTTVRRMPTARSISGMPSTRCSRTSSSRAARWPASMPRAGLGAVTACRSSCGWRKGRQTGAEGQRRRVSPGLSRLCADQVDKQRADFQRLGVIGDWDDPY